MTLKGALHRMRTFEPRPFVTPFIAPSVMVDIFTVQAGVPIKSTMMSPNEAGWYTIFPQRLSNNRMIIEHRTRPADIANVYDYLNTLPRFIVVAVHPLEKTRKTWLCVPYNAGDAEQRGWKAGAPLPLHLVDARLQHLDIVLTRNMAGNLLYEGIAEHLLLSGDIPQNAQDLLDKYITPPPPEEDVSIKNDAAFMGATVMNIQKIAQYRMKVTWMYNGAEFTSTIAPSGRVISAGICLDGTDHQHTMATLIATMEEARGLQRPDVDERYYL